MSLQTKGDGRILSIENHSRNCFQRDSIKDVELQGDEPEITTRAGAAEYRVAGSYQ